MKKEIIITAIIILVLLASVMYLMPDVNLFGFTLSIYDDVTAYVTGSCDGLLTEVWEYRTKISSTTGELVYIAAYPDLPQTQSEGDPINIHQTSGTIDVIVCDSQRGYDGTGNCAWIPLEEISHYEEQTMYITIDQGSCYEPPPTETCFDNIQNQDETGVDCGGVCPACDVPEFPWLPLILAIAVIILIAAAVKFL